MTRETAASAGPAPPPTAHAPVPSPALKARLSALKRTMCVDRVLRMTESVQPALVNVCQTLAAALDTRQAMLALVTGQQDEYPVHQGFGEHLPPHPHQLGPTLCHHVVSRGEVLVLNDTRAHAPFNEIGSVVHGGVQAYLGAPVRFQGEVVGSLCVVDQHTRTWTDGHRQTLEGLAMATEAFFASAWAQHTLAAERDSLSMRQRELEEGVISRQLVLREVTQGLTLLQSRLERVSPSLNLTSMVALCEDLQCKLRETHQGVLASLALPGHAAGLAHTSWAELLALAVVSLAPSRLVWTEASAPSCAVSLSHLQVAPQDQARVLKTVVCVLSHCLKHLPASQSLAVQTQAAPAVSGPDVPPHEVRPRLRLSTMPGVSLDGCLNSLKGLLQHDLSAGRIALQQHGDELVLDFIG